MQFKRIIILLCFIIFNFSFWKGGTLKAAEQEVPDAGAQENLFFEEEDLQVGEAFALTDTDEDKEKETKDPGPDVMAENSEIEAPDPEEVDLPDDTSMPEADTFGAGAGDRTQENDFNESPGTDTETDEEILEGEAGLELLANGKSGKCGANAAYSFVDGVLYITPDNGATGTVQNYASADSTPWSSFRNKIKALVIKDGITRIGDYAFARCLNIQSVEFPRSLTYIGIKSFSYCDSLENVNAPAWKEITISSGNSELKKAYDTKEALVPSDTKGGTQWRIEKTTLYVYGNGPMEDYKFQEAPWYKQREKITRVIVEKGVTHIGTYAFCNFFNVTEYDIAETVKSIGGRAFYKNTSLSSIKLPSKLEELGAMAFQDCSKLDDIKLPDTLSTTEYYTFCNCTSLTSVQVSAATTSIKDCAFYNTPLKTIIYGGTEKTWNVIKIGSGNSSIKQSILKLIKNAKKFLEQLTPAILKTKQKISYAPLPETIRTWSVPVNLCADASGKGKVTYKSSNKSVAAVSQTGKVTFMKAGTAKITITAPATDEYKKTEVTIPVTVRGIAGTSIRTISVDAKRKLTVSYNKRTSYSGYQIQISKTRDFKSGISRTISDPKAGTFSFDLPSKGTWYIRMRTIKRANGRTHYSKWSGIKKVKVKK